METKKYITMAENRAKRFKLNKAKPKALPPEPKGKIHPVRIDAKTVIYIADPKKEKEIRERYANRGIINKGATFKKRI